MQLAAYTCSITTPPSYLKVRKLTLIGLIGFLSENCDVKRIKVGCTCVHIL